MFEKSEIMKIPVLFTEENSNYTLYDGFDCFDEKRNAFSFTGRSPIIAHPPCRLFSRLRKFSSAAASEKKCAFFALSQVRMFGGILEHPRSSTLWHAGNFNLDGSVDSYGGFLRSVNLSWFGYGAEKKTMLYFVGIHPSELPPFPISFNAVEFVIRSSSRLALGQIKKKERSSTPAAMILYFSKVINIIRNKKENERYSV